MVNAVHAMLYAADAEKTRVFLKEVIGLSGVDAGRGWLIFALPPAEIAVHPTEGEADCGRTELYLMCDDIHAAIADLKSKGVACSPAADRGWGIVTSIKVPGYGEMGLYQPRHPVAFGA